jgi:hypothetical protein
VGEPVLCNRILEGAHDVILADDLIEGAGSIFAREDRITHEKNGSRRTPRVTSDEWPFSFSRDATRLAELRALRDALVAEKERERASRVNCRKGTRYRIPAHARSVRMRTMLKTYHVFRPSISG